jgi:hypothetical protein
LNLFPFLFLFWPIGRPEDEKKEEEKRRREKTGSHEPFSLLFSLLFPMSQAGNEKD